MGRVIDITRRTALIELGIFAAWAARAQPNSTSRLSSDNLEIALLEKSALFEVLSISGALKETRQSGQELVWRRKERPSDAVFRIANISVGLLRSETGGQVITTFSGDVSSLGYSTPDEVKLHVILRTKAGAALYTSALGIWIKCTDKDQSLHPFTAEIPRNIAGNVFANVSSVEITEHTERNSPGARVFRCG